MNYIYETAKLLKVTLSTLSKLIGVSFKEMSDIIDGKVQPSNTILESCRVARQIFLGESNTLCVK